MKRPLGRLATFMLLGLTLHAPAITADDLVYPTTEAGRHARDYFTAYNADEPAMRTFFTAHISAADLKTRPAEQRLEIWHRMRDEQGRLTPVRVLDSKPDELTMLARNEHGDELRLVFHCAPDPPHTLLGIQVENLAGAGGDPGGAGAASASPSPAGPPPTDAQIVTALASELDSLSRIGAFSGAVQLDKDGTTLFARAYGMADRKRGRTNTTETRFDIGSINKIFTTTAIHQLAQQGKLALDDSIARFLPDYPAQAARKITIRMLLEHRSGVPDVLEMPELWKNALAVRTADDWYRLIRDQPLEFEPGTRERYSNGGFVILGMIVQRVSGEDYYAYMRDHLYRPAHMSRTDSYEADRLPADVAVRYTNDTDSRAPAALAPGGEQAVTSTLGRGSAAGGGYSTVGDLVRFARAMRAHVLLDASHTDAVIGPGAALGIAGGSPGVNALVELSGPYTLVALANLDPPAAERLAKTVGRMVRLAAGTPPPLGPSPH